MNEEELSNYDFYTRNSCACCWAKHGLSRILANRSNESTSPSRLPRAFGNHRSWRYCRQGRWTPVHRDNDWFSRCNVRLLPRAKLVATGDYSYVSSLFCDLQSVVCDNAHHKPCWRISTQHSLPTGCLPLASTQWNILTNQREPDEHRHPRVVESRVGKITKQYNHIPIFWNIKIISSAE